MITVKMVEDCLANYRRHKKRLSLLEHSMQRFSGISPEDVIEAMAFSQTHCRFGQACDHSDRTARIAEIYQKIAENVNAKEIASLYDEHRCISERLDMLDTCIANLDEPLAAVVRELLIEDERWSDACEKLYISRATAGRRRLQALLQIQSMLENMRAASCGFWRGSLFSVFVEVSDIIAVIE